MNKITEKIAKEFNIVDKVQKLENELMQVKGCVKVDFDLFGFYDNMNQVIFVVHYDIETDKDYFVKRKEFINNILKVANNNGLTRTEDQIEDYGTSFYFVTRCSTAWMQEKLKKIKVYEVIQEGKNIGLMGAIKDYKIDCGSLVECEGVITGLSLNSKHEVKRNRFYGILSHWFNGSEENQFNVTIDEGHLNLSFNFIKETELKYNN